MKPAAALIARKPLLERFLSKIGDPLPSGCWPWTGSLAAAGYGLLEIPPANGKRRCIGAHRLSVLLSGREIPPKMVVDHICENPACVRPTHLRVVTHKFNILRGDHLTARLWRSNACIRGHVFSRSTSSGRRCLPCHNMRQKAYAARKKAACSR